MERPRRSMQKKVDPDFINFTVKSPKRMTGISPLKKSTETLSRQPIPEPDPQCGAIQGEKEKKHKAESRLEPGLSNVHTSSPSHQVKSSDITPVKSSDITPVINNPGRRIAGKPCQSKSRKPSLKYTGSQKQVCSRAACKGRLQCEVGSVRCSGTNASARWGHISSGEHMCNLCFELIYRRSEKQLCTEWLGVWNSNATCEGTTMGYVVDQRLSSWLQCTSCNKWRRVHGTTEVTPQLCATYRCGDFTEGTVCDTKEDQRVAATREPSWLSLLHKSHCHVSSTPAASFLRFYHPDNVGMSAYHYKVHQQPSATSKPCNWQINLGEDQLGSDLPKASINATGLSSVPSAPNHLHPFPIYPGDEVTAGCCPPDRMTPAELVAFPEYSQHEALYLGLRNLILAQWALNCTVPVEPDTCARHFIIRGLVRIKCTHDLPRVIDFLTRKNLINYGIIRRSPSASLLNHCRVVVVGAGAAGLGAARHLQDAGAQAAERIGGRIKDNEMLCHLVGEGAQMVNGTKNNPISAMARQVGVILHQIEDKCDLYRSNGQLVDEIVDKRMDFQFNAMLDAVASWSRWKPEAGDMSLQDKLWDIHKLIVNGTSMSFPQEEQELIHFHMASMEFACGAPLSQVSALQWDHNESVPQFAGPHCFLDQGFSRICQLLADGLDIKCNSKVSSVEYGTDGVSIMTSSGERFSADHAIITLPLAVLQKRTVAFHPPLPNAKIKAIQSLGSGLIEKVGLEFEDCFWGDGVLGHDFFGHVPDGADDRGCFTIFYDITSKVSHDETGHHVLLTYLTGNAISWMKGKSDEDIIMHCVQVLRKQFPKQTVPQPVRYFVTHWGDDENVGMAYSYVPVGSSAEHYDTLAQPLMNRLFFAGEATNRSFPQSVTGAYLSGLREANHILQLPPPAPNSKSSTDPQLLSPVRKLQKGIKLTQPLSSTHSQLTSKDTKKIPGNLNLGRKRLSKVNKNIEAVNGKGLSVSNGDTGTLTESVEQVSNNQRTRLHELSTTLNSNKSTSIQGSSSNVNGDPSTSIQGSSSDVNGDTNTSIQGSSSDVNGDTNTSIQGSSIAMNGDTSTSIQGSSSDVNGDTSTSIQGSSSDVNGDTNTSIPGSSIDVNDDTSTSVLKLSSAVYSDSEVGSNTVSDVPTAREKPVDETNGNLAMENEDASFRENTLTLEGKASCLPEDQLLSRETTSSRNGGAEDTPIRTRRSGRLSSINDPVRPPLKLRSSHKDEGERQVSKEELVSTESNHSDNQVQTADSTCDSATDRDAIEETSCTTNISNIPIEEPSCTTNNGNSPIEEPSCTTNNGNSPIEEPSCTTNNGNSPIEEPSCTTNNGNSSIEEPSDTSNNSNSPLKEPSCTTNDNSPIEETSGTLSVDNSAKQNCIPHNVSVLVPLSCSTDDDLNKIPEVGKLCCGVDAPIQTRRKSRRSAINEQKCSETAVDESKGSEESLLTAVAQNGPSSFPPIDSSPTDATPCSSVQGTCEKIRSHTCGASCTPNDGSLSLQQASCTYNLPQEPSSCVDSELPDQCLVCTMDEVDVSSPLCSPVEEKSRRRRRSSNNSTHRTPKRRRLSKTQDDTSQEPLTDTNNVTRATVPEPTGVQRLYSRSPKHSHATKNDIDTSIQPGPLPVFCVQTRSKGRHDLNDASLKQTDSSHLVVDNDSTGLSPMDDTSKDVSTDKSSHTSTIDSSSQDADPLAEKDVGSSCKPAISMPRREGLCEQKQEACDTNANMMGLGTLASPNSGIRSSKQESQAQYEEEEDVRSTKDEKNHVGLHSSSATNESFTGQTRWEESIFTDVKTYLSPRRKRLSLKKVAGSRCLRSPIHTEGSPVSEPKCQTTTETIPKAEEVSCRTDVVIGDHEQDFSPSSDNSGTLKQEPLATAHIQSSQEVSCTNKDGQIITRKRARRSYNTDDSNCSPKRTRSHAALDQARSPNTQPKSEEQQIEEYSSHTKDDLSVTPEKLSVTRYELRVTPDKLSVTPDKLSETPDKTSVHCDEPLDAGEQSPEKDDSKQESTGKDDGKKRKPRPRRSCTAYLDVIYAQQ